MEGCKFIKKLNKSIAIRIITLLVLVLVIYIIYMSIHKNALILGYQDTIESRLNIKLPKSTKIANFEKGLYNEFGAKVIIDSKNINDLKEQLNKFFPYAPPIKLEESGSFENAFTWWDLDENNINKYYMRFVDGDKTKEDIQGYEVWAFITNENNGHCFLYIFY